MMAAIRVLQMSGIALMAAIVAPPRRASHPRGRDCGHRFVMGAVSKEPAMNSVQIEQKSYEMPPKEGISIAQFLTVADIERSARYYERVFGARILSLGDGNAPGYLQLANIWMILNVGGGPTPDKPTVTLSVPDPNHINSFLNMRVADIQACYELWKSRGAEFITEPIPKYGEIRCYIRDPDGYIIEVGQSTDLTYG
jgi:catechol 2,3-dioxygenase-like lactoylglutathione lyase family enzyme